ncbi:hypothetical protein QVD17_18561 [Tagetes erecta]|uniref:Oleosin n=1 Tax=Tagetes erecta TaxID=13708 RepID=A0AAD8KIA9_TARER|nr:hypothetical protein QVD17_18561 [Tagetes erecta]
MATTTTYNHHHITTHPHHHQPPSTTKTLPIITLLPVAGTLLALAGLTFIGTIIALALTTPLFIIFSPVLIPALLTITLAVTGFLASGTFGLTGLSSLSYLFKMVRNSAPSVPEQLEYVKETIQDVGEYAGQKTMDLGEMIQHTAHEIGDQDQDQCGVDVKIEDRKEEGNDGEILPE